MFNDPELKGFDMKDALHYGLWKQDLFSSCFWVSWFDKELIRSLGIDMSEGGSFVLSGGNFFAKKSVFESMQSQIETRLKNEDRAFFARWQEAAEQTYKEGVAFSDTLVNAAATVEVFDAFLVHARKMSLFWCFAAAYFAPVVEKELQNQIVHDKIPAEQVPHLVPKMTTPLFKQQEELKVLSELIGSLSIDEIKQNKELAVKIESHRKEYAWIEIANWIGDELTFERLVHQIQHMHSHEAASTHLDSSPRLSFLAESLGKVGYNKQGGAEYAAVFEYKSFPFLHRVAQKIGVTYRELTRLTHDEIRTALEGSSSANLKALAAGRSDMKWLVKQKPDGSILFVTNRQDIALLEWEMVPRVDKNTKEIRGQVGNKGKVQGSVRVIMNVDDFGKMQSGDILVTTMTTPDFVILMQKSAAIVTDIGGMLCHAAIVSREINKPCVIGTKFATQILKDGDRVEVDADNGVIRIVS